MAVLTNSTNTCRACKAEKPIGEFYRFTKRGKEYAANTCKTCAIAKSARNMRAPDRIDAAREWRKQHKRKLRAAQGCRPRAEIEAAAIAKAAAKAHAAADRKAKRDMTADAHVKRWREVIRAREWHRKNMLDPAYRAKQANRVKQYRSKPGNAERKAEYMREYIKAPQMRVHHRVSKHIREALGGTKNRRRWESLVGYSKQELMVHLERQFLPGMSWSNMDQWHIDHITPRALLKYDTEQHPNFKACWHITNLRPMWAADNISKGARHVLLL